MHYVIVCVHLHLIMKLLKMIWSDPPVYWCCYVSPYKDICRYSIIFIKLKQSPPPYICIIYSPIPFLGVYCFPKIGRNLSLTHDHHHNLRPNRITKWIKLNLKVTIVVKSDEVENDSTEFSNSPIVGRDRAPSYFTRISNNTSSDIFF